MMKGTRRFILAVALTLPFAGKAQSIVGSWHLEDIKLVALDKAAEKIIDASHGVEMEQLKKLIDYKCIFNANGTMIWESTIKQQGMKPIQTKGTYIYSGGKLSAGSGDMQKMKDQAASNPMMKFVQGVDVRWQGGNMIWHYETDVDAETGKKAHGVVEWIWKRI